MRRCSLKRQRPTPTSYLDELNAEIQVDYEFSPRPPPAQQAAAEQPAASLYLRLLNKRVCANSPLHESSAFGYVTRADSDSEQPTHSRQRLCRNKVKTPLKLRCKRVSRRAFRAASGAKAFREASATAFRAASGATIAVKAALNELCLRHARWFKVGPGRSLTVAVVVELFAGSGRFTKAMQKHMPTLKWDILMGESYDLLNRENQCLIFGWIKAGRVAAVWIGTPCDSMTMARNRPGGPPALRNKKYPHGMPNFRPADKEAVRVGNLLGRFSAFVFLLCCVLWIPAVIENPRTSWLWSTKWMVRLRRRLDAKFAITEFCQWQSLPYRKSTALLHTHIDLSAVSARRCIGAKRGMCLATGHPHRVLKGIDTKSGKFWTKIAEPYPKQLCNVLALAADAAIARRRSDRNWQRVDSRHLEREHSLADLMNYH